MPLLLAVGLSVASEPAVSYLFLVISFFSVYRATRHTTAMRIALLLWGAFWGLFFSTLFHEEYPFLHFAMYVFAVSLIAGHVLNIRYCRSCRKE
jgi:hypothetical protein